MLESDLCFQLALCIHPTILLWRRLTIATALLFTLNQTTVAQYCSSPRFLLSMPVFWKQKRCDMSCHLSLFTDVNSALLLLPLLAQMWNNAYLPNLNSVFICNICKTLNNRTTFCLEQAVWKGLVFLTVSNTKNPKGSGFPSFMW